MIKDAYLYVCSRAQSSIIHFYHLGILHGDKVNGPMARVPSKQP